MVFQDSEGIASNTVSNAIIHVKFVIFSHTALFDEKFPIQYLVLYININLLYLKYYLP